MIAYLQKGGGTIDICGNDNSVDSLLLLVERNGMVMAKTHTSWQVKQRYNEKVYSRINLQLEKDLVAKFKDKCVELGVSQASVIREAIEKFVKED